MKTLLDKATRAEVLGRIGNLSDNSARQWGKMTVGQMMKHCAQWDEMAQGKRTYKQSLIGKLFGKVALKSMMKDVPMKPGMPTTPEFIIKESGSVADEKARWITTVNGYETGAASGFIHPFFGRLTKEQAGILAYKHADHHLRQFNS